MAFGFLMTGGASTRMRRDKALLPWYQQDTNASGPARTLAEHLCAVLRAACDEVFLVGDLPITVAGVPRLPDAVPGLGPLAGLLTVLEQPGDSWRLILSCDTPFVTPDFLRDLLQATAAFQDSDFDAVVPRTADGQLHPLCAVYHPRIRETLRELLTQPARLTETSASSPAGFDTLLGKSRAPSMHQFLRLLRTMEFPVSSSGSLRNLNTLQEYLAALGGHQRPYPR